MFSLRVSQNHRPSMRIWSLVVVLGMLPFGHPWAMPASSSVSLSQPTAKTLDEECPPDHDLSEGFSDNGDTDTFMVRFNAAVAGTARSIYSPLLRTRHGAVNVDLTCDVPVTDIIENPSDSDLFTFSVQEGEIVHIKVVETPPAGANFSLNWRVLDKNGAPAPDCGYFNSLTEQDCGPLPANGSPYQIEVQDGNQDATGSYTVRINYLINGCPPIAFTNFNYLPLVLRQP